MCFTLDKSKKDSHKQAHDLLIHTLLYKMLYRVKFGLCIIPRNIELQQTRIQHPRRYQTTTSAQEMSEEDIELELRLRDDIKEDNNLFYW